MVAPHGCSQCYFNKSSKDKVKSDEQYRIELKKIHPQIELLSEYKGSKYKIQCKCLICNNIWKTTPGSLLKLKYGCPKCAIQIANQNSRLTNEEYNERLSKCNPNVENISGYVKADNKILFRCKIHNIEFCQLPSEALVKCGCIKCYQNKSYGEIKILDYLKTNKIQYQTQKRFDDCKNIRKLPFDFYLPDYNMTIEYDGKMHFVAIDYFGGEEELAERQRLDKIKTDFCANNNIRLLRIPYWEFDNIEKILERELNI